MKIKRIIAGLLALLMVITSITVFPSTDTQAGVKASSLKENKDYMIVAKSSGMAITVGGGLTSNKAPVFQDSAQEIKSQVWNLENAGNGYYYIKNKNSDKYLVPKDNSGDEGRMMHQYKKENKDAQKWKITDVGDGYCRISPKHKPNYALNVFDNSKERGANIIQWTYGNGSDNSKWEFREVSQAKDIPTPPTADAKAAFDAFIDAFVEDKGDYSIITNVSGFWAKAESVETLIDGYDRFGDEKYKEVLTDVVDGFIAPAKNGDFEEGTDWEKNEYNDDIMWACIMCARTYLITKDKKYLDIAKQNFDMVYKRASDNRYGGGIYWKQNHDQKSKNACVNGPATIAACYIAQGTGDDSYYEKAKAMIEWEKNTLVQDNGRVYDNICTENGKESKKGWAFTYNQGTFIGGCMLVYEHYKDQKYLDWAKKTAEWCATTEELDYCFENSNADLIGFKGILARWMGKYTLKYNVKDFNSWMQKWADIVWDCRNDDNLMYTTMATPTTQDIKNCKTNVGSGENNGDKRTIGDYCAFGCSSTVSWLVNMSDMEARQNGNDPALSGNSGGNTGDTPIDTPPVEVEDDEEYDTDEVVVGPQEGNGDSVDIGNSSSNWDVKSPDSNTVISIKLNNGKLRYSVKQNGTTIVEESDMGINTSKGDFTNNLKFKSANATKINETYKNLSGIKEISTNHCHEATLTFTRDNTEFQVIARAYNDGVAFRYKVNSSGNIKIEPNKERTSFTLPKDSEVWYMNYAPKVGDFMYESEYEKKKIDNIDKNVIPSMPMTYKTGNKYALITEADKRGTYVGSFLQPEGNRVLRMIFDKKQTRAVETSAPFQTPWRSVIIGDLNTIATNTMVENLSPAPDAQYNFEEWVQPGVSSWSWVGNWGNGESDQSKKETHMNWIDLASKMGWRYYIMDERWQPNYGKDGQKYKGYRDWFEEVRDYAEEKGVDLIAWVHKDDMDTASEREERFKQWSEDGIKGIKIDFFYTETQDKLQLHDEIYKTAAKYKMLVNVHGSNPPSGERRTYPNVLAREAVRGQEQGGIKCEQYTLIPFIRAAVGTADVTEELYSKDTNKTSMGFQIALSVLVENGIRSLGSKPNQYLGIPAAISYYRNFPEKWDDSILLDSKIGDYVNIARRSGDGWYAAGISVKEKNLSLRTDFLEDGVTYTAILYHEKDNKERKNLKTEIKKNITKNSTLNFHIQNGGGYAVKLFPQDGAAETTVRALPSVAKVGVNKTKDIKVMLTPATSGMADFKWSVKDSKIASVEETAAGATIKGLREGSTQVTATSLFDETKVATFHIEVTNSANNDTFTVEFDSAGGSEVEKQFITKNNKANKPEEPKKGDFKFSGWYVNGKEYDFNSKVTKDLLLTAKWDGEYKSLALEAEAGTLAGNAKALASTDASNGYLVEGIGGADKGTITFNIPAEIAEKRTLKLYFAQNEQRKFQIAVNDSQKLNVSCSNNGSLTKPADKAKSVKVELKAGDNTIVISGVDSNAAPNLDKIELGVTAAEATKTVEKLIAALPENITVENSAVVQAVKAAYDNSVKLGGVEDVEGLDKLNTALLMIREDYVSDELKAAQTEYQTQAAIAESMNPDTYTEESWKTVTDSLAAAKAEFDKGAKADAATLKGLTATLAKAIESVEEKVVIISYSVTFDSKDGSDVPAQTIVSGEKAQEPDAPTKKGYTFAGWRLAGVAYDFNTPVTKNITLTARWETDNELQAAQGDFERYEKDLQKYEENKDLYDADSWAALEKAYKAAKEQYDKGNLADIKKLRELVDELDEALSALVENYNIVFDSQGGSSVDEQLVEAGDTIEEPAKPTKNGYIFAGWYLEGSDTPYDFETPVYDHLTLVAKWNQQIVNVPKQEAPKDTSGKVQQILIKGESKKIAAGKRVALTAVIAPATATNPTIKWTSSNPALASVDANGVVTTTKAGKNKKVTITATAADGSGITDTYEISIMEKAVKKVKITGSRTVKAGKTIRLKARVTPKASSRKMNSTLAWSSSNTNYATVSSKGVVKTKKAGKGNTVKITARATDGSNKKSVVKIRIK